MGSFQFVSIHAYGDRVAKPVANGFVVLATYAIPVGRSVFVSLHQGLDLNPAGAVQKQIIDGFTWRLRRRELKTPTNFQDVTLRKTGGDVPWTLLDGRPVVRNFYAASSAPFDEIAWGIDVTAFATIPAEIESFYGAILGLELATEAANRGDVLPQLVSS